MPSRVVIDPTQPSRDVIRDAVEILARGGVVAYPTDTLYGLGADPRSASAVARLFRAKGRAAAVPIPLIAADLEQVRAATRELDPRTRRVAARFWPGPLSVILPADPALTAAVHAGFHAVAVRVPDHEVARALARGFGFAMTATSANRSGAAATTTADAVIAAFGDDIDLVIDAGPTRGGEPSTIVDLTGTEPRLVRAGVVPWAHVLESLKE